MEDEEEEGGGGGGWLVSYADLMTLLFAAFVVLYGIKPEGETKEILGVTSSIREAFVEVPDEIPEEARKGPIKKGIAVFKYFKADQLRPPIIKRYRRNIVPLRIINKDFELAKSVVNLMAEKKVKGRNKEKAAPVTIHRDDHGFTIRLVSSYFFPSGAYRMHQRALAKVRKIGETLKDIGRPIVVEGHTDDVPPSGTLSNWELSALRAAYVVRYLVDNVGFPAAKASASGYADKKPLVANDTSEGRKMNRRVEIRIRYDIEEKEGNE